MGRTDGVVVSLGAAAMDMVFSVSKLPEPDEMVFAEGEVCFFPGGSTANIAAGIGRLGYRSRFVGRVGNDDNGRRLRRAFEADGVDVRWLAEIEGGRTAQTIIAVDRRGERVIYSLGGEAILQEPDEFEDVAMEGAEILYIGEVLPDVAARAIQLARSYGVTVVYGPGGGISWIDSATLYQLLKECDYVLLSRGELDAVTSCPSHTEGAGRLLESGVRNVIVTLGSDGSECHSRGAGRSPWYGSSWNGRAGDVAHDMVNGSSNGRGTNTVLRAESFRVTNVVDTTGAGDSFAAGFITGLLRGFDIVECLERGNACAALAIQKTGAREAMPTSEELEEFLRYAER
ncbi:MAG: carbohydrate kinase family protein [Bacillota bacterium]|jgi:ribokinase